MNLKRINETRTKFGLSPVKSIKDQILRAGRMLVLSSSVFDFPASVPSHAIYCGPQLEDTSELPLWQPFWPENDKTPLILISLSTTYQAQDDVIRRLLSAVEPLHVHVVVTLGYSLNPDEFQAPSNVKLVPFIPHQQILPYTALAITHGGHGTVLGALSYGVPLICMPMGRDQRDIAARVVWLGTGLRISHKATPRAFRSAITQVLNESSYRDKAKTIALEMARKNESVRALMELEALIRWHNSKRRMKEKNITQRKRNPAVTLLEIIVVLGAPVLCHFLLPLSRVVPGLWRLLGIIPMILGLLLANSGARAFGKAKTGFQLQTGGSSLVISGPFRYTRNPMYLGMVLWLTGLAVLLGSLIVFLFPLLFFVLANFLLIPPEERILQQTFGERFISYRQQVRRWL
jgi:protein-S-isoprenylcysteine O-methyltransferase Ste14